MSYCYIHVIKDVRNLPDIIVVLWVYSDNVMKNAMII